MSKASAPVATAASRLPRVVILAHGGRESATGIRARGLARGYPPGRLRILYREGPRTRVATDWTRRLRGLRPDLVYLLNTAMPGGVVAPLLAALGGPPFVLDTGDLIYEMAVSAGTPARWKQPALWLVEREAQRQAAAIVVRGSAHKALLEARGYGPVHLIRDGYLERPPPAAAAVMALRERLGLEDAFVAGVMGSTVYSPRLGICYGWDLIRALARLGDLNVRGLVIGDGDGLPWLREQARAAGVADRVVFTGWLPYEQLPAYLRLFDVALSTQTDNLPGQVRTTGKLPEYMIEERFILASRVGDARLLLPEEMLLDYHGAVDEGYPERLAARIRELVADPRSLDLRLRLPEVARRHCSYDVLSEKFREVVASVAAATGGNSQSGRQ